jgi:hypothetical protein
MVKVFDYSFGHQKKLVAIFQFLFAMIIVVSIIDNLLRLPGGVAQWILL